MRKSNTSEKIYKISVLTLLVFILITLIAIVSMLNPMNWIYDDGYSIELSSDEFNNLGINIVGEEAIHYSDDYFTFEEFGRYISNNISTFTDILNYTEEMEYDQLYDDANTAEFILDTCSFDKIRHRELCSMNDIIVDKETKTITFIVESTEGNIR